MTDEREQIATTIEKLHAVLRNIENVDGSPSRAMREQEVQPSRIRAMLANLQRQLDAIDVQRTVNEAAARVMNTTNASTKSDKQCGRSAGSKNMRRKNENSFLRV